MQNLWESGDEDMQAFDAVVQDTRRLLIMSSRVIRTLVLDDKLDDAQPFMELFMDRIAQMHPSFRAAVIMSLIESADDWKPSPPVQEVKPDYGDPVIAETFRKVDNFLADPSTGVRRERPAPRITEQS
jgi:hypothetical protein